MKSIEKTIFDLPQWIHFSLFRGMWEAQNANGEFRVFYSQEQAEKFAGIDYNETCEELDNKFNSKFSN